MRKLILGRAGLGKAQYILKILEAAKGNALLLTPSYDFHALARAHVERRGLSLATDSQKGLILRKILLGAGLNDFPGLVSAARGLIKRVKEEGLRPQGTSARIFEDYQRALKELNLYDGEDALLVLLNDLKRGEGPRPGLLLCDGFHKFTNLEWSILKELIQATPEVYITLSPEIASIHKALLSLGFDEIQLEGFRGVPLGLGGLEANSVIAIEAVDIMDEVEEIAREIKRLIRGGMRYRDVGIICPRLDLYADLFRGIFRLEGIPNRIDFDWPLRMSPVIRALLDFGALFSGGMDVTGVLRVIKSGFFGLDRGLVDELEYKLLDRRIKIEELDLLKGYEVVGEGTPERFMEWYGGVISRIDLDQDERAAVRAFQELLREVTGLCHLWGRERLPFGDFYHLIRDAVSEASYRLGGPEEAVCVAEPLRAKDWDLPVVFVCGLIDGYFPPPPMENPFLNEGPEIDDYIFYLAITRPRERLYLTWPSLDSRGDKNLPSIFLTRLKSLFSPEDWEGLIRRRGLAHLIRRPEEAMDEEEFWRGVYAGLEVGDGLSLWLFDKSPEEDRNAVGAGLRWELPPLPAPKEQVYSPSQLMEFVQCPYRHFAGSVLRLKGPPELAEEGLSQRMAGRIVHRVLEEYFRSEGRCDIGALVDEAIRRETRDMPLGLSELCVREEMRVVVKDFLKDELEHLKGLPYRPSLFEQSFILDLEGIKIRGKIDRVDLACPPAPQAGVVVDYKYSRTAGPIEEGLQMPIYLMALKEALGVEPAGGVISAIRGPAWVGIMRADDEDRFLDLLERARGQIREVVREIEAGVIRPGPKDIRRCGRACPFHPVCRFETWWKEGGQ